MAGIDYNNIKTQMKSIIDGNSFTYDVETAVEGDIIFDTLGNIINIELDSRRLGPVTSGLNKRRRYLVTMIVTVWIRHFNREEAITIRDKLLEELEVLIMQNSTINDSVETSMLDGGENIIAFIEDSRSFVAAANITINLDCLISL